MKASGSCKIQVIARTYLKMLIFDFDGVITDSEVLHLRAYNRVLAKFNVEISTKDYYQKYLGLNDVDFYKTLIKNSILQTNERQIRMFGREI